MHKPAPIPQVMQLVAQNVTVPVRPPSNLPPGTHALVQQPIRVTKGDAAQVTLAVPGRGALTLEYGKATFDGCGPLHPRVVEVAGNPGVIDSNRGVHGQTFSTVVWPASLKDLEGTYAVSGPFSARRILSFARSMARDRLESGHPATRPGC
jgi:hypothetical protein